ncbi:hypothetical protein E2I00_017825 [Balaenoptera physalus]|uniref:Uncharacterized protein n=1 Tax=Balaenoptera physalus TaxID=9770 RepID=A0A643BME3_BALPH|nr:hypothetical protein E2I00_017825 [Balaenoptera physalus]
MRNEWGSCMGPSGPGDTGSCLEQQTKVTTPDTMSRYRNYYGGLGFSYVGFGGLGFGNGFGRGSFCRLGYGCDFRDYGYGSGYGSFEYVCHGHPSFYGRYGFSSFC